MPIVRPQQYRLKWPLTATQVENIDTMFETLFLQLRHNASDHDILISAGTSSAFGTAFTFGDANRVTFGITGGTITASFQPTMRISAGGSSQSAATGLSFANSNGVSFGLNGSTITGSVASPTLHVSASGSTQDLTGITFANSNGVTFGLSSGTITASVSTGGGSQSSIAFYENFVVLPNTITTGFLGVGTNSIHLQQIQLDAPLTADMCRFYETIVGISNNAAGPAIATNAGFEYGMSISRGLVLYTVGAGVNSTRLDSVFSTSLLEATRISGAGLSSTTPGQTSQSYTISMSLTWAAGSGATSSTSNQSTSSFLGAASYSVSSSMLSSATYRGNRFIDYSLGTTLPPGYYVVGIGAQTSTQVHSGNISLLMNTLSTQNGSVYGVSMPAVLVNITVPGPVPILPRWPGQGFITHGAGPFSTVSIALSDVQTRASNMVLYVGMRATQL